MLSEATYAVCMDLASFFDTISPLLVAVYSRRLGLPKLVIKYIAKMYEYSKGMVRTAAGTATSVVRRGFKTRREILHYGSKIIPDGNK